MTTNNLDELIDKLIDDPNYEIRPDGTIWSKAGKRSWRKVGRPRPDGYIRFDYHDGQNYRTLRVNRVIYRKFVGELDPKLTIDHIDNNPSNNHPNNLQQISQADNVRRGRSVLTWEIVNEIREKYANERPKNAHLIAREYGIAIRTFNGILSNERWQKRKETGDDEDES
jgi:hypothetical protein